MTLLSFAMSYFWDLFSVQESYCVRISKHTPTFADPSFSSTALEPSSKFHQTRHAPSLQPLEPAMHRRRAGAPRRRWLKTSRYDSYLKEYCCPVSKLNDHPSKKAKARFSWLAQWYRPFFGFFQTFPVTTAKTRRWSTLLRADSDSIRKPSPMQAIIHQKSRRAQTGFFYACRYGLAVVFKHEFCISVIAACQKAPINFPAAFLFHVEQFLGLCDCDSQCVFWPVPQRKVITQSKTQSE